MKCTLVGYREVDYVNKAGKNVLGKNLYLMCGSARVDVFGKEVLEEFVRDELVGSQPLRLDCEIDIEYGRGYQGKATVIAVTQESVAVPSADTLPFEPVKKAK